MSAATDTRTESREQYIARRTGKLRQDLERFRTTFDDTTSGPTLRELRSSLRGLEEELDAACEAAGAEWDGAQRAQQRSHRQAEGRTERRRTIEGAAERFRAGLAKWGTR